MSTNPKTLYTDSLRFTAANFVSTELVANITQAQDTFEVADASQWPTLSSGEFFLAVLVSATDNNKKEVVKVTGVSGSTWTVERAFEDNTSFAFPAQSSIENRLTAGTIGYFRGMTLKGVSGTDVTAYPYCEYLSNGGQTFNILPSLFQEGQRVIFTMNSTATGTFSVVEVDDVPFASVSGKGDSIEVTKIDGDFVVTKRSVYSAKNVSVMTADFTAHPNLDYFVDMSDDTDKNITVDADIIRGGDSFKVHVKDPTGTSNVFINLLFAAGTYAPDSEATTVFIEAATNACYSIQNVNGKFYIVNAAGESYDGAYVMQRLGELETEVSELQAHNESREALLTFETTYQGAASKIRKVGDTVCLSISGNASETFGANGSLAVLGDELPSWAIPEQMERGIGSYTQSGYNQIRIFVSPDGEMPYYYSATTPTTGALELSITYITRNR